MRPWQHDSTERPWLEPDKPFGNTRREDKRYHTTRWRKVRQLVLNRDGGICVKCQRKAAVIIDHITTVRQDASDDMFYNMDNLQSMCRQCHQAKTNWEIAKRKVK